MTTVVSDFVERVQGARTFERACHRVLIWWNKASVDDRVLVCTMLRVNIEGEFIKHLAEHVWRKHEQGEGEGGGGRAVS